MSKLTDIAKTLLKENSIQLIIGFEKGTRYSRPFFCQNPEETGKLILDETCRNNLAVYITKPELTGDVKTALVANSRILKSVLQLWKEHQLSEEKFLFIAGETADDCLIINTFAELEAYIEEHPVKAEPFVEERLTEIRNMSREERWQYWKTELSKCIRCYACRAACPLCYCNRCIVEVNCPQWIDPWAAPLSNMEWQINRVMHMAGRCTDCGACEEACPLDLPIHLLTRQLFDEVHEDFGENTSGNVLSTFNPNDKESFFE